MTIALGVMDDAVINALAGGLSEKLNSGRPFLITSSGIQTLLIKIFLIFG